MMVGHGALSTAGYRYGVLSGNDAPVVKSITKTPEYQAYKAKVDAAGTLSEKLKAIAADKGFYTSVEPVPDDLRSRRVLATNLLADACASSPDAQDISCVLSAALNGVPDKKEYGFLVPTGANVQDLCTTKMTIEEALEGLAKIDKGAASVIAKGVQEAVPAKYGDYKKWLGDRFLNRFSDIANPLTNPLTSPLLVGALAFAAALVLIRISKK